MTPRTTLDLFSAVLRQSYGLFVGLAATRFGGQGSVFDNVIPKKCRARPGRDILVKSFAASYSRKNPWPSMAGVGPSPPKRRGPDPNQTLCVAEGAWILREALEQWLFQVPWIGLGMLP